MSELGERPTIFYRITGKQSIERIKPLMNALAKQGSVSFVDVDDVPDKTDVQLNFVWETACEKSSRAAHNNALVLNKLHNSQVIESKASLAFLQRRMIYPDLLDTIVVENASTVKLWISTKWLVGTESTEDWWAVKASKGNGGRDVWVMNKSNVEEVLNELPADDEYVIQRFLYFFVLQYK